MRARLVVVLLAATTMLARASIGAACVPQPFLLVQPEASGPAGGVVTVRGANFGSGKAEVRWNALDGPLLASGDGPDFTFGVTIPEVPDGLYTLVAIARSAGGGLEGMASASFQVGASRTGSERKSPTSSATSAAAEDKRTDSPTGVPVGAALAGGAVLLVLGGVLGRTRGPPGRKP